MKKKIKSENAMEVWKRLDKEYSKIFDNFKYFDEPNKIMFLNIIIGESIKFSNVSPLNVEGLLNQINSDISNYIRGNLSIGFKENNKKDYIG